MSSVFTTSNLLNLAFFVILASLIIQIVFLISNKENKPDPISHLVLIFAFILTASATVIMSVRIHFIAIVNTYQSLLIFTEFILLVLVIYRFVAGQRSLRFIIFGGTMIAVILLAIALSPMIPSTIQEPMSILKSNWLILHISFAFLGEAFLAVGFVASLIYLLSKSDERKKSSDHIAYISIIIGYFLYTTGGLIFGAIWANVAWGRYWGWDPKEIWALVTFLVYTLYLHFRLIAKFDKRVTSVISIVGFLVALFTFLGVNFLMSSLHSYG